MPSYKERRAKKKARAAKKRRRQEDKNKAKLAVVMPFEPKAQEQKSVEERTVTLSDFDISQNVRIQPLATATEPGRIVIALIQADRVVAIEDENLPRLIAMLQKQEDLRQNRIHRKMLEDFAKKG